MPKQPKGLEWNPGQKKIAQLLEEGRTAFEISKSGICSFSTAKKIADAIKEGQRPPNEPRQDILPVEPEGEVPPEKPPDDGKKPKKTVGISFTSESTEAALLRLTPKVQNIPLTPDIFIGYMCAVTRGFGGDMTDWLSLASRDFWFGRDINPYEQVSVFKEK